MLKKLRVKKQITFATLVLALAVAVFLNWQYSRNEDKIKASSVNVATHDIASEEQPPALAVEGAAIDVPVNAETEEQVKNYGDAQLVSLGKKSGTEYFEKAKLNRQKSRDSALDKLQKSLKSAKLTDAEKTEVTKELTATIQNMTIETDIENIAKSKGFIECVASLGKDKANIAVMTKSESLTKSEVMQIRDIILSKTNIPVKNIAVVEVK